MRLEQDRPDGPWVEKYDIDRCQNPDCGLLFAPRRFSLGTLKCECARRDGHDYHRTFRCWSCRHISYDPPHDEPIVRVGGDRYSLGG